jgi:hypothetical protein
LDGLCSAGGGGLDRDEVDKLLASLGNRVFLLHDVHAPGPVLFQTRWTLSYLRGPLTRDQLKRVTASRAASVIPAATPSRPPPRTTTPAPGAQRPAVPAGFDEVFLRPKGGGPATWEPGVFGEVAVHYVDTKARVDVWVDVQLYAPAGASGVDWDAVEELPPRGLGTEPGATASWGEVPAAFGRKNAPTDLGKQAATWVYRSRPLRLQRCAAVGLVATPGEAEGAFRARLALASREARDAAVEALRTKTAPKLAALEEKQRRAEARFAKEQQQAAAATVNTAVSFGATLFGALFGRKTFSAATVNKATSAVRSAGRAVEEHGDIEAAKQEVQAAIEARRVLAAEVEAEVDRIGGQFLAEALVVDELVVVAKKADLKVERVALAWRASA